MRDIAHWFRDEDADINGADFIDYVLGELERAGFIAEARAALPRGSRRIPDADPALAIVRNIAHVFRDEHEDINGADFIDYVYGELDEAGFIAEARATAETDERNGPHTTTTLESGGQNPNSHPKILTPEEQTAIRAWAGDEGRRWKAALRHAWETGNYRGSPHDAVLQRIRNRLGPSWLVNYRLPVNPGEDTRGYHCWVITSTKPHETRAWVAVTRAEAVAQVEQAVRTTGPKGAWRVETPTVPSRRPSRWWAESSSRPSSRTDTKYIEGGVMAKAIVQDGVIMGIGASEAAAYHVAETLSLTGGLYQLNASAVCVHASDEALRDWNENGPDARVYIDDIGGVRSWREASNDVLSGELWVVLVDGRPRPGNPPLFAESEEKAIQMWRHHMGLRNVHQARLSAVPRAALKSTEPKHQSHVAEVANVIPVLNSRFRFVPPAEPNPMVYQPAHDATRGAGSAVHGKRLFPAAHGESARYHTR